MKNKARLPRNPVAKNLHKFNRPSTVPNKRRKDLGSRVARLLDENASECDKMPVEEVVMPNNEPIDEEE